MRAAADVATNGDPSSPSRGSNCVAMKPFKKSTSSFASNTHLASAVRRLTTAAREAGIDCSLPGAFPSGGTPVQQALWLHRLLAGAASFAGRCGAVARGSGTALGSDRTHAGQAIRVRLQERLKAFVSDPSPAKWDSATTEAAELISILAVLTRVVAVGVGEVGQ
jgi:hypothetical protein